MADWQNLSVHVQFLKFFDNPKGHLTDPTEKTLHNHPKGHLTDPTEKTLHNPAHDPDIPMDVAGAKWYEVPGIWWNTVERLSWTMVGKPAAYGCRFRSVQ